MTIRTGGPSDPLVVELQLIGSGDTELQMIVTVQRDKTVYQSLGKSSMETLETLFRF